MKRFKPLICLWLLVSDHSDQHLTAWSLIFISFLIQIFSLIFLLFFCLIDFTLTFEILIKFTVTNDYFVLYHVLLRDFLFILFLIVFYFLIWDFSQAHCYELLSDFMQHFQKNLLFVFLNIWSCTAFLKRSFVCIFKFPIQKHKFF